MTDAAITADTVRETLIARAEDFADSHGYSLSRISKEAIKDSKFLSRVKGGDNFTIATYQRVLDWLDAAEREHAA